MATYERRKGFWRVKVRRAGFPAQTRSFNTKVLAQTWARDIENKMDRGGFVDRSEADTHTLGDVLKRYLKEVMRRGDLTRIERKRIDLRHCVLVLPDTKNGSPRAVPLSNVAKGIIEKVLLDIPPGSDGLLFAGVTNEAIKLSFQRAIKRAGIEDFRCHDLRHEATSRLHERGLNPIEVMSVTGHKSMSSMLRYSHVRGLAVTEKLNNPIGHLAINPQQPKRSNESR